MADHSNLLSYWCVYHHSRTGSAGFGKAGSCRADAVIILTVACGSRSFSGDFRIADSVEQNFVKPATSRIFMFWCSCFLHFVPKEFLAVAFDAGGVTTGPITVPFIMALGIGVAAMQRNGKKAEEDSFGMVALCSIGPILAVLIMGMCLSNTEISYTPFTVTTVFFLPGSRAAVFEWFSYVYKRSCLGIAACDRFFLVFFRSRLFV